MATKRHLLRPGDGISREELMEERRNYTDEQARKLGYPSATVLLLSDRLGEIAGKWRRTKDDALVPEYRATLYDMILKGYDVDTLPIQDQLPPELMQAKGSCRQIMYCLPFWEHMRYYGKIKKSRKHRHGHRDSTL